MWKRLVQSSTSMLAGLTLLLSSHALGTEEGVRRYRGKYTYGHEVSSFCPNINSHCYGVDRTAPEEVRATLKQLATRSSRVPYPPICVVVEGRLDREAKRVEIAADDGMISIKQVYGMCDKTDIVTQGDLQHHRWILDRINGETLSPGELDGMIPELEFGEGMKVAGHTGCNRISGQAALHGASLMLEHMVSTRRMCRPLQNEIEKTVQQVLSRESTIKIEDGQDLTLKSDQTVLHFRRSDWRK